MDIDLLTLKTQLTETISKNPDKKYEKDDRNSYTWKTYSIASTQGKAVYQSFTDEELLVYLRTLARELDHAPSQGEVFWVLRDYIKRRFEKWPYALRAAGLSSSAGKGGRTFNEIEAENQRLQEILEFIRDKAGELGKIPHPKDVPEVIEEIRKHYDSWTAVIKAADLDEEFFKKTVCKIPDLENEYLIMLDAVKDFAYSLGRSPLHGEVDDRLKKALIKRCGSWRNALYQIDLEPVIRMQPFQDIYINHRMQDNRSQHTSSLNGCYYKVLNLSSDEKKLLADVRELCRKKGGIPMKKDVPKELRQALQKSCGSWGNVLYQVGIAPKDYYAELKKKKSGEGRHEHKR